MKVLSKIILTALVATVAIAPLYAISKIPFDNSPFRWECDCEEFEIGAHCNIAAGMYLAGKWEDANTGKFSKIKGNKKKRVSRAKELFSIGCNGGSERSCELLSNLKKGILKAK